MYRLKSLICLGLMLAIMAGGVKMGLLIDYSTPAGPIIGLIWWAVLVLGVRYYLDRFYSSVNGIIFGEETSLQTTNAQSSTQAREKSLNNEENKDE